MNSNSPRTGSNWRTAIAEAYANNPCSRDRMDRFNARCRELAEIGVRPDQDLQAHRLHASLVMGVRAYLEGTPIRILGDEVFLQ